MSGVVAAGHSLTAEAGAQVLREGGNAVDAAVCAVLASFAVESPLTGFGAGGFMMVHDGGETTLLDFFVAAPGRGGIERGAELVPVQVHFDVETVQTFYVGPVSCGVPGTAAGLEQTLQRFGTMPLAELAGQASAWPARGLRSMPSRPTSSTSSNRSTLACLGRESCMRRRGARCARASSFAFQTWPRHWSALAPRGRSPSATARSPKR